MVNLTVRYDKKIGSNVFVVRDDEPYVSSTKTILTITDIEFPTIEGRVDYLIYRVSLTINVLRETGESNVVIYDGDDVLEIIPWEGVPIPKYYDFASGTAHKLKAIFMGNKHCLKSHSKSYDVFMDDTSARVLIEYQGNIVIGEETSFTFKVMNALEELIDGGKLTVSYTDGTNNSIKTADVVDGYSTVDFGEKLRNILKGLIHLTVVYDDEDSGAIYGRSKINLDISKYYNRSLRGYFRYTTSDGRTVTGNKYILGEDYVLEGTVLDFMDNPYTGSSKVEIEGFPGTGWYLIDEGYVDENGKFSTTLVGGDYQGITFTDFLFVAPKHIDDGDIEMTPEIVEVTDLIVTPVGRVGVNTTQRFYVDVYGNIGSSRGVSLAGVPVVVTNSTYNIDDVYITDSKGRVVCDYVPQSVTGGFTLNIRSGNVSTTYNLRFYITNYVAPEWQGQNLGLVNANKQTLQTGMQYNANPKSNNPTIIYADIDAYRDVPQRFSFKVVSTTDNLFYYGLVYRDADGTLVPVVWDFPDDNWLGIDDVAEYSYDPNSGDIICTVIGRERFRTNIYDHEWYPAIIRYKGTGSVVLNNIEHEILLTKVSTKFIDYSYSFLWFGGRLVDRDNKYLAGKNVKANVTLYDVGTDSTYTRSYSLMTNNDGYVQTSYSPNDDKVVAVTFVFDGDTSYASSSQSITKKRANFVDCEFTPGGSWWGGRLVDDNNEHLVGKTVSIDVTYIYQDVTQVRHFEKTTNNDGYIEEEMGYVHITRVTYVFAGDSEYNYRLKTIT